MFDFDDDDLPQAHTRTFAFDWGKDGDEPLSFELSLEPPSLSPWSEGPTAPAADTRPPRRESGRPRHNFSQRQREIIEQWISEHGAYACTQEADQLASLSGLSFRQVRIFLSNFRMRRAPPGGR